MSSPSTSLSVWISSWLAGVSAPDDVIDVMAEWAPMHLVVAADGDTASHTGLSWPGPRADGVAALLAAVRTRVPSDRASVPRHDTGVELLLPGPGATSNLAPKTAFAHAAISAGNAVVVGHAGTLGLGLVPTVEGPDVLRWTVFSVPVPAHYVREFSLGEAEYAMRDAVRSAAETLGSLQALPTGSGDPRAKIAAALTESSRHRYPSEMPERALRVLESADRVAAILAVAGDYAPDQAPTASAVAVREDVMRPLWSAVRAARLSAIVAAIESTVLRA